MKLGTIRNLGNETVIGRIDDDRAVALPFLTMSELIEAGDRGLDAAHEAIERARSGSEASISLADVDWMAPNPRPSKILGCAVNNGNLNRKAHRPLVSPMFFIKGRNALTGHLKSIDILKRHGRLIPEPEPVVVFGKTAKNVAPEKVLDHVFGYTLTNDVTASGIKFSEDAMALREDKDLFKPFHASWRERASEDDTWLYLIYHSRSKASDTFAAMGPWITTKDEVPDPNQLTIRGAVDGEEYTVDSTANYHFTVEQVLAEASIWFTMEPGDCLHTGTASVGTEKHPGGNIATNLWDYDGKYTDVTISELGTLRNLINCEK